MARMRRTASTERLRTDRGAVVAVRAALARRDRWMGADPPSAPNLPTDVRACLFDLDGVLTNTAVIHAAAWRHTFDDYLRERDGGDFVPTRSRNTTMAELVLIVGAPGRVGNAAG